MKLGYARVSASDQDASMQIEALLEAGVARNKIFVDTLSGITKAKERPALSELMRFARAGDAVYCWRIDRLGRSLIDVLNTVQELTDMGVGLHSIVDGVDPSTPQGRLQLGLFATLAEYERELIRERVRTGIAVAKANGVRFGRLPSTPERLEDKLDAARALLTSGKTGAQAAAAVGWSRATLYRYLKHYGEQPDPDATVITTPRAGRSSYAKVNRIKPRRK